MASSYPVLLFGELLARYTTPGHQRFVQAIGWETSFTGGEANAGLMLADLGHQPMMLSAVPTHAIGQACVNHLRRFGIGIDQVQRRDGRLGILYVEQGSGHRASQVIYDRQNSVFSQLTKGAVDWESALTGMRWLHFTGTAPALSSALADLTREGCEAARARGIPVSCDISYRSALWSVPSAREVLLPLMALIDVLIVNEEHAQLLLDAPVSHDDADLFSVERYHGAMAFLAQHYHLSHVAFTVRTGETADITSIAAAVWHSGHSVMSPRYDIQVIDRIGAGDAFSGAFIAGILEQQPLQHCVEFATAASCLQHSVPGDFAHASREEILSRMAGGSAGRVRR